MISVVARTTRSTARRLCLLVMSLLLAGHPLSGCAEESDARNETDSSTLSGDSGAEVAPDAAGEAGDEGSDGATQCVNPLALEAPRECEAGEPGCYVLSNEWRLLGPTAKPPEATSCGSHLAGADYCGCPGWLDAGLDGDADPDSAAAVDAQTNDVAPIDAQPMKECGDRGTCVSEWKPPPSALGGPGGHQNVCRILCLNNDECVGNEICWAGYCTVPDCTRNSDCNRDRCGHCTQVREWGHASSKPNVFDISTCVYEGPCGPDSCTGCMERGPYQSLGVHFCP